MGRAIYLREQNIPGIRDPLARLDLDAERFSDALACLQEIGRHLQNPGDFRDHPWKSFGCENTRAGDELAIEREIAKLAETLEGAAVEARQFEEWAGAGSCPSPTLVERLPSSGPPDLPLPPVDLAEDILACLATEEHSVALAAVIDRARAHGEHLRAAAATLSVGAVTHDRWAEWLRTACEAAISQRLGDIAIVTLRDKLPALIETAALANEAVDLAEGIARLDLGSAATMRDLERFIARLRVCGAPAGIKGLLTPEHRFPHAGTVLTDAKAEADRLAAERQMLEGTFVVADALATAASLQALKVRLRATGGRWFSIFNGDYRDARKALLGFLRSRQAFSFPSILDSLERLEHWRKGGEDFSARADLRGVLGPAFQGLETDWAALGSAMQWTISMTREALPWTTVETIAAPEKQQEVRELTSRLEVTLSRLQTSAAAAADVLDALFDRRPWQTIELGEFRRAASEWAEWLRGTLDAVFPLAVTNTSTFAQLKDAAEHLFSAEDLAQSIAADETFQTIAGQHARGLESDWQRLTATRDWVERLRDVGLPQPLFHWLLTEAVDERLTKANALLGKLAEIASRCAAIIGVIETYGTIDRTWLWGADTLTWAGRCERIGSLHAKSHLLQQWALFRQLYRRADVLAARFAVDPVLEGTLPPEQTHEAFDLAVNEFHGYEVLRTFRELENFTHDSRLHLAASFRKTDRDLLEHARGLVAQRAAKRSAPIGNGQGPVKAWTEAALLRNEVNKHTRHIPIRQLMQRAGRAVAAWKPCLMMSPLSVAQYLDPRCAPFDLVVMDEASQIRPEDALGAVARAKQIVVVGDTKQMPPSNYWSRTLNDEDEDEDESEEAPGRGVAQDAESILECAKSAFPPAQRLLWHYRSQHESLIRFSNYAYYDEELIVFPAASDGSGQLGIKFHHIVEGRYKAGARVNETEANAVARAALDHLMENRSESLLVATFNKPQQELIDELVEKLAAEDPAVFERLEEARQHPKEPFAVKNLENVQGDERDVIFVSCTYGPDLNSGVVHQRFGPVAGAGGRRRLNVLFTRAKRRVELFSSITHEQIVGRPGEPNGVNDLRDYLRFAQSGILADSGQRTGQAPDSYFEEAVMRVVESTGLRAVPQVGVSSYRIDIGVEHPSRPGEFLLGIECDGAMYHSSKSARDRDRLRQEVLERRGWKIHRIWSTDWFRQNKAAKERLLGVLRQLM